MLHYLIDGYNVIGQMSFLSGKTLRGEREGLIKFIEQKRPQGKNEITVIFDGQEKVFPFQQKERGVRVVFSRGISADDKIKKMVEKRDAKQVVVVSDDKEIIFYVRSLGAKVLSVKEFVEKGLPKKREVFSEEKKMPQQTGEITAELEKIWLK
ncbi:MAG: NYN domain-containing protein [Candidatus Omnitrophica bacterium]|nr:NYN domain-containing protein [Candidatus Omnitrophota bacterium]